MAPNPLPRVRKLCLALLEATEVEAWGAPTFRVRKKLFAMYANKNNHHGGGRNSIWIKATPANQSYMLEAFADRFFKPAYVGPSGWIGVWLDGPCDWKELVSLLKDGYRLAAPKKLAALLPLEDE